MGESSLVCNDPGFMPGFFIVGKTVRCAPLHKKTKSLRPKEMERQVLFMNGLAKSIADNLVFFLEFLGIVVLIFVAALIIRKVADKKNGRTQKIFTTRMMAVTGMLSAISVILYMLDFSGTGTLQAGLQRTAGYDRQLCVRTGSGRACGIL